MYSVENVSFSFTGYSGAYIRNSFAILHGDTLDTVNQLRLFLRGSWDILPHILLFFLQQVPHLGGAPRDVLEQVLLLLVQQVSAPKIGLF
jgi:hypothetical protein